MASVAGANGKPFKLVLLGETAVGKSSLVLRYMKNEFHTRIQSTMGAAYSTKTAVLGDGTEVPFEIWDTAGQERYHSLAPMYYRTAHAAIIVYDIRRRDTFEKAKHWVSELAENDTTADAIAVLVGNKTDLVAERIVNAKEGEKWAKEQNLMFFECSAKTNTNVEEVFTAVAKALVERFGERHTSATAEFAALTKAGAGQRAERKGPCGCG